MTKKELFSKQGLIALTQLVRLPNLLMIILSMVLLRYCILVPFIYHGTVAQLSPNTDFIVLMLITLLLAIGGYVINDYFDVKIDTINRPDRMVVNRFITPRNAIKYHMILNGIAILMGFYLSFRIRTISFGFIFPFISGLLWIYSAKYKRVLLWGNIIVSMLSAFVILVVLFYEFFWLRNHPMIFAGNLSQLGWVSLIFAGYALFAFLISMIREIIKDMEDMEGDEKFDCRTIPVVLGVMTSRWIVSILIIGAIVLLGWAQVILFRLDMMMVFWYFLVTVQLPALYLIFKLFSAKEQDDYHFLSSLTKVIMVAGILSMEIIYISN